MCVLLGGGEMVAFLSHLIPKTELDFIKKKEKTVNAKVGFIGLLFILFLRSFYGLGTGPTCHST